MSEAILSHEAAIRAAFFVGALALLAGLEQIAPCRAWTKGLRLFRWANNMALVIAGTLLLRFAMPVLAVGLAATAAEQGWGLFNIIEAPVWLSFALSLLALDFAIWLQHVLMHSVPALWRLHRVHHADVDFDVTTALRFHPLEILVSMGFKLAVVMALGPSALAVLVFEVILNATAMFNHANARLPRPLDRALRLVIVTPDMHRVHHSMRADERDSNYGFNLPWWDRLFGTYRAQPADGHEKMAIGVPYFRTRRDLRFDRMLLQPFLSGRGQAEEGRRSAGRARAA